jgi:Tol biopolymer transport system component
MCGDLRHNRMRQGLGLLLAAALAGCGGGSDGEAPSPTPSPSAPALVFTGDVSPTLPAPGPSSRQEVFTADADGKNIQQLTHDGREHFLPHFSPDGSKILYTLFSVGGYGDPHAVMDLVVYDRASGAETQLTHTGSSVQGVWSPDGRQIAYGDFSNNTISVMNADGSSPRVVARSAGTPDDRQWGDYLWSSDNWLYFSVAQDIDGCFKVRLDRMRPDGAERTRITDGGPNCTPPGLEQSGEADPGISPDGKTIYSSRGLPLIVPGTTSATVRHLYRFSSEPFAPGKVETDLSLPAKTDCVAGVPKVSPGGDRIALFLLCPTDPAHAGVTLTDAKGSAFTFVVRGFGPDWNPAVR